MSEDKKLSKIDIKELGFSKDQDAIEFVKKLRAIGTTIYYMTDGEDKKYFLGKFEGEIPILPLALKQKIESLEKEVESMKVLIQELKVIKAIEPLPQPQQKIELPPISAPIPETPKPLTENTTTETVIETPQLGFKSRLEPPQTQETPTTQVQMQSVSFKCPYCNHTFSENVPKGKKVVEVKCPKCGMTIYKKSWWTRKKKIAVAGLVCFALFLIWLFI
jgi:predicted RNA-binding Zn-ribbon protein involved in translation (DUF1610 family)